MLLVLNEGRVRVFPSSPHSLVPRGSELRGISSSPSDPSPHQQPYALSGGILANYHKSSSRLLIELSTKKYCIRPGGCQHSSAEGEGACITWWRLRRGWVVPVDLQPSDGFPKRPRRQDQFMNIGFWDEVPSGVSITPTAHWYPSQGCWHDNNEKFTTQREYNRGDEGLIGGYLNECRMEGVHFHSFSLTKVKRLCLTKSKPERCSYNFTPSAIGRGLCMCPLLLISSFKDNHTVAIHS